MGFIRTRLRSLYDSPWGDRFRTLTGINPPINVRPRAATATVSDLFPWRVDAVWQTCFELINLPSLLHPADKPVDRTVLMLFAADGSLVGVHEFTLAPFESRRVDIEALLGAQRGMGSFACFHDAPPLRALAAQGSYLSDRGYVGFRRRGDKLWSYVHGNLHVLAQARGESDVTHVGARSRQTSVYSPQVRLDDARSFDLIYSNPTDRPLELHLRLMAPGHGTDAESIRIEVPVRGTTVVSRPNETGAVAAFESLSRASLWRPVVFKHYQSHFDVFHG